MVKNVKREVICIIGIYKALVSVAVLCNLSSVVPLGVVDAGYEFILSNKSTESALDSVKSKKVFDMDFNNNLATNTVANKSYTPINKGFKYVSSVKGNGFEANSSKIQIPFKDMGLNVENTITVAFILKWDGKDNNFMPVSIFGEGTGEYARTTDIWFRNGCIGFNTGQAEFYGSGQKIEPNRYYSVVAEFNLGNINKNKLYIDGVRQSLAYGENTESKLAHWNQNSTFTIAGTPHNDSYLIKDASMVDEVRIYKGALSSKEIDAVVNEHKVPELSGYLSGGKNPSPVLNWASEMLPEDVLWRVGYEEDEQSYVQLVYNKNNGLGDGGQKFDNSVFYSGRYSLYTPVTRPNKGNWVLYPYTGTSPSNHIFYNDKKVTLNNSDKISISYMLKSSRDADVNIAGDWVMEKRLLGLRGKVAKPVKKGDRSIVLDDVSDLKVGDIVSFDSSASVINYNYAISILDVDSKTISFNSSVAKDVEVGFNPKKRTSKWIFDDAVKKVPSTNNQWKLINTNVTVNNSPYINWFENPVKLRHSWRTYSDTWLDDLKVGYATRAKLYRDGKVVYSGYASELSDTSSTDKVKPNNISLSSVTSSMSINDSNDRRTLRVNFSAPEDNGTRYRYQVSAISKSGIETPLGESEVFDVVSGIKGYSYVVDKKAATVPDNSIETTSTYISSEISDYGVYYVHIKAIDNAGNVSDTLHYKVDVPRLTVTPQSNGSLMRLDWYMDDVENKTFKIFQKKDGSEKYQSISATSFDESKRVNVLNIYPGVGEIETYTTWDGETVSLPKSAGLKRWMEEPNSEDNKGYGKGIIEVTPIRGADFNANPTAALKDANGKWRYDVIYVGHWDASGGYVISNGAVDIIGQFIDDGRGVLAGHDMIGYDFGANVGLSRIREKFNIKVGYWGNPNVQVSDDGHKYKSCFAGTNINLTRKGLLTSYPWDIGEEGARFSVPNSHSTSNFAYGDVWMTYPSGAYSMGHNAPVSLDKYANFYLTSWNNTAMIQTGHSNGAATPDEQKILANTLFYLNQLSSETFLDDYSGKDIAPPDKPSVSISEVNALGLKFNVKSMKDNPSRYSYYIEATDKQDNTTISNVETKLIESGLAGYSYVIDNNPNTKPDNVVDFTGNTLSVPNSSLGKNYIHIASVDRAGNVSDVVHYPIDSNSVISPSIIPATYDWSKTDVSFRISQPNVRGISYPITKTQYRVNGGQWVDYVYGSSIVVSSEGINAVEARNVNSIGKYSALSSCVIKVDKTKPKAVLDIPISTTSRKISVNISNIVDAHSGIKSARVSESAVFDSGSGFIDIVGLKSKRLEYELSRKENPLDNYSIRTLYVELIDLAGNSTIISKSVKYDAKAPNKPVIVEPRENSSYVGNKVLNVSWEYKDTNADLLPLAQKKADVKFKDTKTGDEYLYRISGAQASTTIKDIPVGEYSVTVDVYNMDDKKSSSDSVIISVGTYKGSGVVSTIDIIPRSRVRYLDIVSKASVPTGMSIDGVVYYTDEDYDEFDKNSFKRFEIKSDVGGTILDLGKPVSKIKVVYKMKGSGSNLTTTPSLEDILVYGK